MLLSHKLGGRFALSNVAQILSLALLFLAFPRVLRARDVIVIVFSVASVVLAAVHVAVTYGYRASVSHGLYFLVAAVYLLVVFRLSKEHGAGEAFLLGLRRAIPLALVVMLVYLAFDVAAGLPYPRLGFDDNSHTSIAACLLAFAALRFMRSPLRLLVGVSFFAISLITYSRMPFFFAPFFVVAFVVEYSKVRRRATEAWQVYLAHLLVGVTVLIPLVLARNASDLFGAVGRVLAPGDATNASTSAHLVLLSLGAQLKLENIGNLVLGITPGGFSGVIVASDVDLTTFAVRDPTAYSTMLEGSAPLHSTFGSIALELPVWLVLLLGALLVRTLYLLVVKRDVVLASFLVALIAATTFYSSHNELYFVVGLAMVTAAAYSVAPPPGTATTGRRPIESAQ
ncbi:hypothetical protein [Isoptericola sp. NPDC058082]|uniref:hypothetical protein n=1 Tax=Isoptericola sp. NPDC058082 TaxID=3346331 RepID=UPI0036E95A77